MICPNANIYKIIYIFYILYIYNLRAHLSIFTSQTSAAIANLGQANFIKEHGLFVHSFGLAMAWHWCQRGSVTAFLGAEYQAALSTKGNEKGHTRPGLCVQFLFLFLPSHKRPIMPPPT